MSLIAFLARGLQILNGEVWRMSDEILTLLGGLGMTAQDVAARLAAQRITAHKGATSFRNPIVRYLKRHLDANCSFYLPLRGDLLTAVCQEHWCTIELPDPVSKFLDAFHGGEFPHLEEQ